jgi:hypothetical protein
MQSIKVARTVAKAFAVLTLIVISTSGCDTTTIIHQTVIVSATSSTTAPGVTPTSTTAPQSPTPPPGIWCLVKAGQMPLMPACEIFPSEPKVYNPPQSETILAGRFVGPEIGNGASTTVTEHMNSPWAADVDCATNDNSNSGMVRIFMVAHTTTGDFYSWGDQSCGPPAAPSFGYEYFRKAPVTVTLTIQPLTGNLVYWLAQLIQL